MRIHICSDLHLEFGKMPRDYAPPECDVVILAGDIAVGVVGVMWAIDTFDCPVIMVAGNHEFYSKRIYSRHIEKMKEKAAGTNVRVLDNETIVIDGVRFIGATMWTDFDLYGTWQMSMSLAQRAMNDYTQILLDASNFMGADDTRTLHLESKQFFTDELATPFDGKTVCVTHHAPSELSTIERYKGDKITPCYASRLEHLMLDFEPVLWAHGHMHASADYMIGSTRVVCNPRGYVGHELNDKFEPQKVVTI